MSTSLRLDGLDKKGANFPQGSSEPGEEVRSAHSTQGGLAPSFPSRGNNPKIQERHTTLAMQGPWELTSSFMHWLHLCFWLGVQDTTVGRSDPALPLGRETDFKTIKHVNYGFL